MVNYILLNWPDKIQVSRSDETTGAIVLISIKFRRDTCTITSANSVSSGT